jgi:hypothetical protein
MPKTTRCEVLLSQRSRLFSQENNVDIVGVTGSIPVTPTILSSTYGRFAKFSSGSTNLTGGL